MAKQLRGKQPANVRPTKPKLVIYGPPGVGKTWTSLEFPKVYFIDVEGGATRPQYIEKLLASGGAYFGKDDGSQSFRSVIDEVSTLASVKHDYLTLVIDSFSMLYNLAAAEAEGKVGSDFGKDKKEAQKPTRQLLLWLERLDMNVVLICHAKEKWARQGKELVSEGQTFDGWDKLEYVLDLVLQVTGTKNSTARVQKTRIAGFERDSVFRWCFDEFARRAGHDVILRPPETFQVATAEQVREIKHLMETLKVEPDWAERVFAKSGVQEWAEMSETHIAACIKKLHERISPPPAAAQP